MAEISEYQALQALMQMYQSKMSMVNSACIAIAVGLFVVPLFALSASLKSNGAKTFGFKGRLLCFLATLALVVVSVYYVNKTIFLGALLWESLSRLEVIEKEEPLMEYYVQMKVELRDKYPIFRRMYKLITQSKEDALGRSYKRQVYASIAGMIVGSLVLFSAIWWRSRHFFWYLLGSELICLLSIWLLFHFARIM